MQFNFSRFLPSKGLEKKIFIAIIALAIFARIFILFAMPDAPLTDTLYHLTISRFIVENHALPFNGIPNMVRNMPVPLYHVVIAIPFAILPIELNISTARVFPFIFSAIQLLLSFILLKKLFPKNWFAGFAFVAIQPLLLIYGALNYVETFASSFVLLSFIVYWKFVETGKKHYLLAMPFVLAGMAMSKETATILVPIFFLAFLFEIWKQKPKQLSQKWIAFTAYFVFASVLLSSAWFAINFLAIGGFGAIAEAGVGQVTVGTSAPFSLQSSFLYPLEFNTAFWSFLPQAFASSPLGISLEIAFTIFSIVTLPVLAFIFYGMIKGSFKLEKPSIVLLSCFVLAMLSILLISPKSSVIYIRILVPLLPLFGIAVCTGFKHFKSPKKRTILIALFAMAALYSIAFISLYAMHFNQEYNNHLPLYNFIKELPDGSIIAVHEEKKRQVYFIGEKEFASHAWFYKMNKEEMQEAFDARDVSHIAKTCSQNPWDVEIMDSFLEEGYLQQVYQDSCSTLYKINR